MTAVQLLIVEQITYMVQGFMLFFYAKSFFKMRYSFAIVIANIIAGYFVLYGLSHTGSTVMNIASAFVINSLLLLLLFEEKLSILLFHSAVLAAVLSVSELLCLAVYRLMAGDSHLGKNAEGPDEFYAMIFARLIYFIFVWVICYLFGKKRRSGNDKGFWALMLMPLSGLVSVSVLTYAMWNFDFSRQMQLICSLASVLILVANVTVFFIYERSLENAAKISELMIVQQKNELDKQYFDVIEQANNDMKMLAHDMKNHLMVLRGMDRVEAVDSYIDKLYPKLEHFSSVGSSKNRMLDLIISKYKTICESKGISFEFKVRNTNLSYIDDVDLSVMLNNLLDNSVEAALQCEKKEICLEVFSKNDMCDAVVIKNSCSHSPETSGGELLTTKKNKTLHGIGIKSVTAAAEKYNALYDWHYDEKSNAFITTMVFQKEEKR